MKLTEGVKMAQIRFGKNNQYYKNIFLRDGAQLGLNYYIADLLIVRNRTSKLEFSSTEASNTNKGRWLHWKHIWSTRASVF
jgi:hypothetical protein